MPIESWQKESISLILVYVLPFEYSSELGCLFPQVFERKFPFIYSFFMRCVMGLSLYMPPSLYVLADMLIDMDYTCSQLCRVYIFMVSSSYIFVLLACGFRTIFAECCFTGRYLQLCTTVMSWLVEFSGRLALAIFILGNSGIDMTAFNVAPFRNLACWDRFDMRLVVFLDYLPIKSRSDARCHLRFTVSFSRPFVFFISAISNFF